MIKNLLTASILFFCTAIVGMGQNATIDLYIGTVNELNEIWDTPKETNGDSATVKDSVGGPDTPYEGSSQLVWNYYAQDWWAGNGGFNVNDWGWGAVQDYSGHTHLKLAYKGSGTAANTLQFALVDSTPVGGGNYYEGPYFQVASNSTNWTVAYVALSDLSDASLDLTNIQSIRWRIGLGNGVTSGKFFVDAIQIMDLTAPTVSSLSASSGQAGDVITITGTNFNNVTDVKFNGTSATTFTINSSTSIDVTVPAGATTGNITVHNPVNSGSSSTFTVTGTTGTSKYASLNVSIGPNPSTGVFTINTEETVDEVIVTDYLGNVVLKNNRTEVDLSNLSNGIYFVTIISGDKKSVEKLVKQ